MLSPKTQPVQKIAEIMPVVSEYRTTKPYFHNMSIQFLCLCHEYLPKSAHEPKEIRDDFYLYKNRVLTSLRDLSSMSALFFC